MPRVNQENSREITGGATNSADAEFDAFAGKYDAALNRGLALSGEDKDFFALGRLRWLAECLRRRNFEAKAALDFGCGTGSATPFLFQELGIASLSQGLRMKILE